MRLCLTVLVKLILCLLSAALVVVGLLLSSRIGVRVRVKTDGSLTVWGRIGFFSLNLTRLSDRRARKRKRKKPTLLRYTESFGRFGEAQESPSKTKTTAEAANGKAHRANGKKKKSTSDRVRPDIPALIETLTDALRQILTALGNDARVRVRRFLLTAACPEAADTALLFGGMNAALGSFWSLCERFRQFECKKAHIGVYADFLSDTPCADIDVQITFRGLVLVRTAFKALGAYIAARKTA